MLFCILSQLNRIEIKRKEIQDIKDEIHQLEDKRQKLMKMVSGDFMLVKMMIVKKRKHVSAAGGAERRAGETCAGTAETDEGDAGKPGEKRAGR